MFVFGAPNKLGGGKNEPGGDPLLGGGPLVGMGKYVVGKGPPKGGEKEEMCWDMGWLGKGMWIRGGEVRGS